MKDDRFRVPIDEPYLTAVGLAVICFARLEWNAAWCCEKIERGYIHTIEAKRKTAGDIAQDLARLARGHPDLKIREDLGKGAEEFVRLVRRRNALMHANPATAPNGDQRLFRNHVEWSIQMVNDVSDEFVEAGGVLNHHVHLL